MRAKEHSKLAKSEDGQRAAAGEYGLLPLEISNYILHSLHALGIFAVGGFIPLFDLVYFKLACVKYLEIQPTKKLLIDDIWLHEWGRPPVVKTKRS